MPATATAKTRPAATPLDAAQLDLEVAESDVKRLTLAVNDLRGKGPGADPVLLERLQIELEVAQKGLRRADLEAAETVAAADAPISAKALGKIRDMRQRAETLHAAVMARTGECQRLRERAGSLRNEIAQLRDSWAFRESQREVQSGYVFPPNPETRDHPAPARGAQKTPKAVLELAQLERALESASAELTIAMVAKEAASTRWRSEHVVLNNWEEVVRLLGPAARHALDSMPRPGAETRGAVTRQEDFRDGIPGATTPMIR